MARPSRLASFLALLFITLSRSAHADDPPFPVHLRLDAAAKPLGAWRPVHRFFGADEPNYAYMKDGQKLLHHLGHLNPEADPAAQGGYFRTHNLLTTGDGTPALKWGSTNAYTEDAQGHPVYDWTILDRIFDAYRAHGLHPYAQVGFMPQALSTHPDPYQHHWTPRAKYDEIYTGWAYPPKDYAKFAELVYQWTKHCVDRYGKDEVERWYWEIWNEPNIGYWRGTPEEFRKLHDYATDAIRRACPTARVGGPDAAGSGGKFTRDFLEHCLRGTNAATGQTGTPLDFVSFHAKGAPKFQDNHVRMGLMEHLRTADDGFKIVASFPELKSKPIVIGESDPDGCAACQGPQLGYRNTTMYSSYTAESFARIIELADRRGVNLDGILTWAFEFEDQPFFAGFRVLATNGLDLPVLNVFRAFSKLAGQRLPVESDAALPIDAILKAGVRTRPDVSAIATLKDHRLAILIWHYHDDDLPGPAAAIELTLASLPAQARTIKEFRIDDTHANAYTAWKKMNSPAQPTPEQYAQLEKASQLQELTPALTLAINGTTATIQLTLPRQGVTLLVIE